MVELISLGVIALLVGISIFYKSWLFRMITLVCLLGVNVWRDECIVIRAHELIEQSKIEGTYTVEYERGALETADVSRKFEVFMLVLYFGVTTLCAVGFKQSAINRTEVPAVE